jgi:hypothetical protein
MRRAVKVKSLATRVPLRKTATNASASPTDRRGFPAWIAADENGVPFPAKAAAMPRVRDGLVLRTVSKKKSSSAKGSNHAPGAR